MKKCSGCFIDKPVTEYYLNKKNKDGFQAMCKPCYKGYLKTWHDSRKEEPAKVIPEFKTCRDCGLKRPIGAFGKRSSTADKKNIYCKQCWKIRCKKAMRKMNAKDKD